MNRNYSIDVVRLIGAFFIIIIHVELGSLPPEIAGNLKLLGRWAVPFYFMASGYFLGTKYLKSSKVNIDSIKKIIGIYIIANLIYLPITILKKKLLGVGYIPPDLELFIYGTYWHLWFLSSLILGYLVIWYLISYPQFVVLRILSIVLLVFAILANAYFLLLNIQPSFEFSRLLLSVPFMYMGFEIGRKTIKIGYGYSILLILAGLTMQFAEAAFFKQKFNYPLFNQQFLIGTICAAIGIFMLTQNITSKNNAFSKAGEKYSLFIYIYHPFVILIQNFVITTCFPVHSQVILWTAPLITFTLTYFSAKMISHYMPALFQVLNGDIFKKYVLTGT